MKYQLRFFRKFIGFGITWYDYDGTDGRLVYDWVISLGFVWVIRLRNTQRTWNAPYAKGFWL